MASFVFTADAPLYYPTLGFTAVPGESRDFESAPDTHWKPAEATSTPAVAPAAQTVKEAAQNA